MARQLSLIEPEPEWRLSDEVRETGKAGIARARAALAAAAAHPASATDRHRTAA